MLTVPVTGPAAFGAPVSVRTAATAPQPTPSAAPQPPSPSASPTGEVRTLTPAVTRQLDGTVQQVMREANVPGVSVGLWTPGQGTCVRSFGVADRSNGRPMSPDLYTRIGSETKTFTVTALLKLVDEGRAGLDDPIGRYVAGVPSGDRITLRELAGMRSGLFDYTEDPGFFKAFTSDPQRPFTPRQLLAYAFKHPVLFPPGQKFSYAVRVSGQRSAVSGQRSAAARPAQAGAAAGVRRRSGRQTSAPAASTASGRTAVVCRAAVKAAA
jgi:D-alanyl-D-alanine carboxypeptidase